MRITIVGLGEVGRCYATALHAAGHSLQLCEPRPSAAATLLASALGVPVQSEPGAWLEADWVLSCVTGATALSVAEQLSVLLKKEAHIADLTTASPAVKRDAARKAAAHGIGYVDTAIMGSIALTALKTPLLAAGDGATQFKGLIEQAGGRLEVIAGGAPGDAISIKILRSIFTKGMEALCVELLMSAEQQGVRELLYEQLSDLDKAPLRSVIDAMVRTHVIHAKRRADEVRHAQSELISQGLASVVLPAVEQRFEKTAAALAATPLGIAEPSIAQAIDWLLSTAE